MKPKKSLGQNFLNDKNILSEIVNAGDINKNDTILEIGPGTGNLTELILKKNPKHLIVIEKDKNLSLKLVDKFKNKIKVINKDILECFDELKINEPLKVFGNLPYNISTKILTSFIKQDHLDKKYKKFIFVFQKEVADRIVAEENTKSYGRLTILTSWKTNRLKVFDISPNCFYPMPKVWSSLVTLIPKSNILILNKVKNLEHVTNIFFNHRRKMIKKPFNQLFNANTGVQKKLKLSLNLRPQNLDFNTYYNLAKEYENLNS